MTRKMSVWTLIVILLLSACNFIYWGGVKNGFHCDEIYSYGLSNYKEDYHYTVYDENGDVKWNTPEDIDRYLTVPKGGEYDYKTVMYNQKNDVHPPLFYMVIHTISSWFPGSYSKYIGIIPNLLFMLASGVLVYLIAMEIFKKRWISLATVVTYLFSVNAVNMVIYVRMYSMLTFFSLLGIYLNIRFIKNGYKMSVKLAISLFITIFLGAFTQYYFLIFIAGVSFFTGASMLFTKKFKKLLHYLAVVGVTAVTYLLVWPTALTHIFNSGRGEEAFANASNSSLVINMTNYLNVVRDALGWVLLGVFILTFLICTYFAIKEETIDFRRLGDYSPFFIVVFSMIFYFVLIAKVAPYQTDRYIAPIFPLFIIVVSYFLYHAVNFLCKQFGKSKKILPIFVVSILVIGTVYAEAMHLVRFEASPGGQNYLYRMKDEYKKFLEDEKGKDCIMVNAHEAHFLFNLQDYKNFENILFINQDDLDKIEDTSLIDGDNEVIVYVNDALDCDKLCKELVEKLEFDGYKYILSSNDRNWSAVYKLYRN